MKAGINQIGKIAMSLSLAASVLSLSLTPAIAQDNNHYNKSSGKVKNIILLISDGCGFNQLTATDYYQYGKTGMQAYEKFPVKVGMSTYEYEKDSAGNPVILGYDTEKAWSDFNYVKYETVPQNSTDSASAATAMSTGTKTYNGYIGMDVNGQPLTHIIELAEQEGKSTGVVTSVELSHATPAGFVAHNISRNNYAAIANEMIYSSGVDVIMGTGNPKFDDSGLPAVKDAKYVGGTATWADLTDANGAVGADANGDGTQDAWSLIQDREAFQNLANGETPSRVIGIPMVYSTLQQSRSGDNKAEPYAVPLTESVPTLEEMTKAALNVLDNNQKGFFVMIEGGAIDWAGHGNQSGRLIEEQIDFNNSVDAAVNWVQKNSNWGETMVIVTGDHETGYLTGPNSGPNSDPMWTNIVNNGKGVLPGMQWNSPEHTNSLIPLFAKGDAARFIRASADEKDLVRGNYIDNAELAEAMIKCLK